MADVLVVDLTVRLKKSVSYEEICGKMKRENERGSWDIRMKRWLVKTLCMTKDQVSLTKGWNCLK